MKNMRKLFALLAMLCLVASVSLTAFAANEDGYYTIRVFSGAQGTIDGKTVATYRVEAGKKFNEISAVDGYAETPAGSKYYPKGFRESGKEEKHNLSFTVTKDQDFVITYGITGDLATYYVDYVDQNGSPLRQRSPAFHANQGDKVYVAYIEVPNYSPDAYNRGGTLEPKPEGQQPRLLSDGSYLFTFTYTRNATGGGGGNTGGGNTGGGNAGGGNANQNQNQNQNQNANQNTDQNANAGQNANQNTNTNTETVNPASTQQEPQAPLEYIDEDVTPLAGPEGTTILPAPSVIEPTQHHTIPTWALIAGGVVLAGLIGVLYWYLLFYRKKKKYAYDDIDEVVDYEDFNADYDRWGKDDR